MEKTDARKLNKEVQQQLRNQAIRLRKKGMTYRDIAEIVGVNYDTVGRWYRDYKKYGAQGIKIKQRGRKQGDQRTLTPEQEKRIQKAIVDKDPDQLKLPFALWTRIAVQQLIKQLLSINMPIRTVGEYLILDNLRVHHSKIVKSWVEEHKDQIELFFYHHIRQS